MLIVLGMSLLLVSPANATEISGAYALQTWSPGAAVSEAPGYSDLSTFLSDPDALDNARWIAFPAGMKRHVSPWVAAALSAGVPLVFNAAGGWENVSLSPFAVMQFLAPPACGLGQLYAGDYERARNIALWGLAIDWVDLIALAAVEPAPPDALASASPQYALTDAQKKALIAVSLLDAAYAAWASWDAFETASLSIGPEAGRSSRGGATGGGINPWFAAGAGSLTSAGLLLYAQQHENDPNAIAISSATLGAGHYFAGDPMRGVLFSLGEPLVLMMGAAFGTSYPQQMELLGVGDRQSGMVIGAAVAVVPYLAWVAYDAYRTAASSSEQRTGPSVAPSLEP